MGDNSMIVLVLMGIISVILILSVVHISGKVDEICKTIKEMSEEQKRQKK
ncbi:MAG: hypothetical protein J1E40_07475 [Oscillospiraceae bacterium]|nr:hypothetical protein [Oscillospiraceae bacterium]